MKKNCVQIRWKNTIPNFVGKLTETFNGIKDQEAAEKVLSKLNKKNLLYAVFYSSEKDTIVLHHNDLENPVIPDANLPANFNPLDNEAGPL